MFKKQCACVCVPRFKSIYSCSINKIMANCIRQPWQTVTKHVRLKGFRLGMPSTVPDVTGHTHRHSLCPPPSTGRGSHMAPFLLFQEIAFLFSKRHRIFKIDLYLM